MDRLCAKEQGQLSGLLKRESVIAWKGIVRAILLDKWYFASGLCDAYRRKRVLRQGFMKQGDRSGLVLVSGKFIDPWIRNQKRCPVLAIIIIRNLGYMSDQINRRFTLLIGLYCSSEGLLFLDPSLVWWNEAYDSVSEKLSSALSPTSGQDN